MHIGQQLARLRLLQLQLHGQRCVRRNSLPTCSCCMWSATAAAPVKISGLGAKSWTMAKVKMEGEERKLNRK
jgi:hypothetical protein